MANERMTISIPRDKLTDGEIEKLKTIVNNYSKLLKRSLKTRTLAIKVTADTIEFPWFNEPTSPDDFGAYTSLIEKLCIEARNKKHIREQPAPDSGNDKYTFRCFLLSLGFIGPEYKADRKVLLQNLKGNSAFRKPQEKQNG